MGLPLTYHWRNLLVRRTTTLLTTLVVAAVVATLGWILGFGAALGRTLAVASDTHKIIVTRRGSNSEASSAIAVADFNKLTQVAGLARDAATGEPLISPEMTVQVALPRRRDDGQTRANVAVRGVTEKAFQVHTNVKLLGPLFATGTQEVVVGIKAAEQFIGLALGDTINLGYGNNRGYKVVGYFSAAGGPAESEIWGYLPSLLNSYNRSAYSSAALRLNADADPHAAVAQIEGPTIQLTAKTEADYWRGQFSRIRIYLLIVGALVAIMALAAIFAIANTMFAAVVGRTREIAMLRTIGFSRRQILTGFILESVLLALLGGGVGCLACLAWLELIGHTKDMYGATSFATLAFDIRLTPTIVALTLLIVAGVGAVGAFFPAWRASHVQVVSALREG